MDKGKRVKENKKKIAEIRKEIDWWVRADRGRGMIDEEYIEQLADQIAILEHENAVIKKDIERIFE